jgi:hypothetical protein
MSSGILLQQQKTTALWKRRYEEYHASSLNAERRYCHVPIVCLLYTFFQINWRIHSVSTKIASNGSFWDFFNYQWIQKNWHFEGNVKISQKWSNFFNFSFIFSILSVKTFLILLMFFPKTVYFDDTLSGLFKFCFPFLAYSGLNICNTSPFILRLY